ncbi:DUF3306 domain-containing protein [Ferrimonas sediminicola]|uniref:DUF3306 domain-containing protein n=1 Tax=Ferrimonas sediminicola TaxID=2569538 RepID=A0A4U1BLL3_9GAMM|nr:DUF3306 domain-containing protein [Ferrimonas sediminicola]TKB50998.1 DUF3306 domain-containing protein [Ferrimonas sediminicola]
MTDPKPGLLSRWQQRLTKVKQEQEEERLAEEQARAEQLEAEQAREAESTPEEAVTGNDAEVAAEGEQALPDPDTIEEGGSFAAFLKEGVDPTKKRSALKALWSQPQYNITDGMAEYALDYSNQPKLSVQVAKEVATKVFRHLDKALEEERRREALAKAEQQSGEIAHSQPELPDVSAPDGQIDPVADQDDPPQQS